MRVFALRLIARITSIAAWSPLALATACGGEMPEGTETSTQQLQSDYGTWRVEQTTDVLAIHAAMMPQGHVVFFGGSQYEPSYALGDGTPLRPYQYRTYTPQAAGNGTVSLLTGPQGHDLFCSGHALTPEGSLLIVGGNEYYIGQAPNVGTPPAPSPHLVHFTGLSAAYVYDGLAFTQLQSMSHGRWYPSVIPMNGNGGMFVLEGHGENTLTEHDNSTVDYMGTFTPATPWTNFAGPIDTKFYYPRAHLLSDGTVFVSSPSTDNRNKRLSMSGSALVIADAGPAAVNEAVWSDYTSTSVLMPYRLEANGSYTRDTVMLVNGLQPLKKDLGPGSALIWENAGTRLAPPFDIVKRRRHGSATILPTGDIFASGGVELQAFDVVQAAEVYRTDLAAWHLANKPAVSRNYHSTALLLPDGRVWTAGSNKGAAFSGLLGLQRELRIELFEPWYYNHPFRPTLTGFAGGVKTHNTQFCVHSPQWLVLSKLALLKLGSVTHAFNADQRYVQLPIVSRGGACGAGVLTQVPANANMVPKGWYHLFVSTPIIHPAGSHIPSQGLAIRIQ